MSDDDDLTISEVRALLGTTRRDARWHLTDELDILCLFARARFDLRQVETTGNEVVEVTVTCAFGSVDFVVPDGTMVVLDGTSFLAGARSDVAAEGDSELPRIEITATTVLGRVKIVSPSHDEDAKAEVIEITAEPAPAIEPAAPAQLAPAAEEPVAAAPAAPAPIPAASPMPVPKPPPNKYAVQAEEPEAASAPAPVVPQPPANKYAVPAEEPDAAPAPAPVVPQPPANKYAVPAEEPDAAPAPAPVVPQPPANKYAVPAEEPDTGEDGAAA